MYRREKETVTTTERRSFRGTHVSHATAYKTVPYIVRSCLLYTSDAADDWLVV